MNKRRLIVRLKGGLGNQMFQYAAGRALAIRNDMELVLDTTSGFIRDKVYRRIFSLGAFPIQARRANFLEQLPFWTEHGRQKLATNKLMPITPRTWGDFLYETELRFMNQIAAYEARRPSWMEGYWQSEKYFADCKDVIAGELAFPTPDESNFLSMGRMIESCESVAVGVRVFEEVPGVDKSGVGGVVPLDFYEKAARWIVDTIKNPIFFVFCTTIAAVKDKLRLPGKIYYITHDNGFNGGFQRLWLISRCKHHIISNSSFYWWGAWMAEQKNPGGMIIASDMFPNVDTIPSRWQRLRVVD